MRPVAGGSRSSAARPILPPTEVGKPAAERMCPISAVVVDLPLVPVTATKRARPSTSRHRSSMSQMISTPAAFAMPTIGCGAGCVSGTPGERTRLSSSVHGHSSGSTGVPPSACRLLARLLLVVPDEDLAAPPATAARTVASPLRASPKTPIEPGRRDG